MFLKNVLEMLEIQFEDLRILTRNSRQPELVLSSVCAVFAQTEIVEAIAADISAEQIVRAVLHQIFTPSKDTAGENGMLLFGSFWRFNGY